MARNEPGISRDQVSLLGWSYELKNVTDYQQDGTVSVDDAMRAIDATERLVATVAALITMGSQP